MSPSETEDGRAGRRVAIAGAGGLIGSSLAAFLADGGHPVLRLVRREKTDAVDEVAWDPQRGPLHPERLEALDAMVYLAGENIASGRWTESRKARLVASRVGAVHRLVDSLGALEAPPRTLVCASAVGYYGDCGERRVTEDAPPGDGFLAGLARRWEDAARAAEAWGARVVLPRFGVVLSSRGGALAKMLPAFRLGLGGPLGSGRQLLSWVALDDTVGALDHALRTAGLDGPVNVAAPEPVAQSDFARVLGRVLRRPAFLPLPAAVLRLVFGEMAEETLLASTGVLPARLQESGFRFRHPELEGALRHELGQS
jgi:hypothetical protein